MKNQFITFIIILTSVFFQSCELTNSDNDISSTDIIIQPFESHPANDEHYVAPKLALSLSTVKNYPCSNYRIDISKSINKDLLIIYIHGVDVSSACLTAIGPAGASIEIPSEIKQIKLVYGNKTDEYKVDISEPAIIITPKKTNFTKVNERITYRKTSNTFAFVCGTNKDNTNLHDQFLALLKTNPNFTEYTFPTDGLIPYPKKSSGHHVDHEAKYFRYKEENDFKELKNTLKAFSTEKIQPNSGVTISLINWKNETYYSWITY